MIGYTTHPRIEDSISAKEPLEYRSTIASPFVIGVLEDLESKLLYRLLGILPPLAQGSERDDVFHGLRDFSLTYATAGTASNGYDSYKAEDGGSGRHSG
ncbi:hypothetical protein FCIRC_12775 [Fusarium circinatum]|uniref:Uncharacterized protein n=1 Tax=Fusarium circinatum TaxID=48490 RepID=A0A8H5SRQ6_FUSCI|nr:hypothetical protein FCIRC_12775 [Fusarium circinatum]